MIPRYLLSSLFVCLLSLSSTGLSAQKYGYVNSLELINIMPEAQVADSLLQLYSSEIQGLYNDYIQEYATKSQEYFVIKDSVSTLVAEAKLTDLQELEKKIKDFENSSPALINAKRDELFQPVLLKASELIKEVAEENGYTWIFDSSSGGIAYAPEGDNVIGLLREKLGME